MHTDSQQTFLAILENMSGKATNKAMKQELGWSDGDYLKTRGELIKLGTIQLGRCRGGMVAFKETLKEPDDNNTKAATNAVTNPFPIGWNEKL